MKGWVHELRGDAKATEHFNCKVLEIGMAAKNCPDAHQECSIQGCHDDDATNPVRPRSIFEGTLQAEDIRYSGPNQDHGG